MTLRLISGLMGVALLIAIPLFDSSALLIGIWLLDVVYFSYLVLAHRNIKRFLRRLQLLQEFFKRQELRALGLYVNKNPWTPKLEGELQILSQDLHLFGEKSIFEFMDETFTPYGKDTLLQWFQEIVHPQLTTLETIEKRQKTWKSWSPFVWPFIRLRIIGEENRSSLSSTLLDFDRPLTSPEFFKYFAVQTFLLIVMWVCVGLSLNDLLPLSPALPIVFYLFFIITFRSQAHDSFKRAQDLAQSITALKPLLTHIQFKFKDEPFCHHFKNFQAFDFYNRYKKLQFLISLLSVQAHPIAHIAVNLFIPWEHPHHHLCGKMACQGL